jgi:integrase
VFQLARRGENIYRRKDGRWEARFIKEYDARGKAVYAYFYGTTYAEVKSKILSYWRGLAKMPGSSGKTAYCLTDVTDLWLAHRQAKLKRSSYVKYHNLICNHIKPELGRYPLEHLTSEKLNAFAAAKLRAGKINAGGGLARKTVKDIMALIKSVLKYAQQEDLIASAHVRLDLPRERVKAMRLLSKEEQLRLEQYLCTDMDRCKLGVMLCLYTGLRVGELCALKWGDIALDDGTLVVRRTMQRMQTLDNACFHKTSVFETSPKSCSSARIIPLPECIAFKLRQFGPDESDAYFLTGAPDKYIEPRTCQNRFKAYIAAAGIQGATFHSLRHTFATRCVEVGFEIKSLSEILGHANVNLTLNRYVHPSIELKRNNMNKLALQNKPSKLRL